MIVSNSIETYYKILGITEKASIEDIKRAFRNKAKELHPDKNKDPDALEQFILLNEAFDYLKDFKTGKKQTYSSVTYPGGQEHKQAREKAQHYAQMQYKEFINSDFYRKSEALSSIADHIQFFSSILILFGAPAFGYFFYGRFGLIIGFAVVFITVQFWAGIFRDKLVINPRNFWKSLIIICKTRTLRYILISLLNLYLLFRFTLSTDIASLIFLLVFLAYLTLSYLLSLLIKKPYKFISKPMFLFGITPLIFNLFFFLNFTFSFNPNNENYSFVHRYDLYGRGTYFNSGKNGHLDKTAYIYIENKMYEDNPWFRIFFDFDSMKNASRITYTFEEGLFGLRVLKSYKFTT